jgi:hypothetical protein
MHRPKNASLKDPYREFMERRRQMDDLLYPDRERKQQHQQRELQRQVSDLQHQQREASERESREREQRELQEEDQRRIHRELQHQVRDLQQRLSELSSSPPARAELTPPPVPELPKRARKPSRRLSAMADGLVRLYPPHGDSGTRSEKVVEKDLERIGIKFTHSTYNRARQFNLERFGTI